MKIGKGVEWVAHACSLLALLPPNRTLSREPLAEFLDVPPEYLAKQLQALSRAGIVKTHRGAARGYQLAVSPQELSLWDITAAVESTTPSFRCTEVRRNGPCGASAKESSGPYHIAATFYSAEEQYGHSLFKVTLAELVAGGTQDATDERKKETVEWLAQYSKTQR